MWWIGIVINSLVPFVTIFSCAAIWGPRGVLGGFMAAVAVSYAMNLPYIFHASGENLRGAIGFFFAASSVQAIAWLIIGTPAALLGLSVRSRRQAAQISN
jgi:hypothetical protein